MRRRFQYKNYLCALFSSFAILLVGTISLLESEAINYFTVIYALKKVIPATFVLGALGWLMGTVIDSPKKFSKISTKGDNLLLDELMKNTGSSSSLKLTDPESLEGKNDNNEEIPKIFDQPGL